MKQAMVLSAGAGKRLMPLTQSVPKPLIPITHAGDSCLSFALHSLIMEQKFERIVVNTHYLSEKIYDFVSRTFPDVQISFEPDILETGGGVLKAIPLFEPKKPLLIMNGDTYRQNKNLAHSLMLTFKPESMAMLLAIAPKDKGIGFKGAGDYEMMPDQRLVYRPNGVDGTYAYVGCLVLNIEWFLVHQWPKVFSLKYAFDKAQEEQKLYGLIDSDLWCDLSTVDVHRELTHMLFQELST
jgi:MurNAc alpha-1-phosphate uridylyltransferase